MRYFVLISMRVCRYAYVWCGVGYYGSGYLAYFSSLPLSESFTQAWHYSRAPSLPSGLHTFDLALLRYPKSRSSSNKTPWLFFIRVIKNVDNTLCNKGYIDHYVARFMFNSPAKRPMLLKFKQVSRYPYSKLLNKTWR